MKLNALEFLWETVNGKATTKIEQTNSNDDSNKDKVEDIKDILNKYNKEPIEEDNVINIDSKKAK